MKSLSESEAYITSSNDFEDLNRLTSAKKRPPEPIPATCAKIVAPQVGERDLSAMSRVLAGS